MGRHAASGSDGSVGGDGLDAAAWRPADPGDPLWRAGGPALRGNSPDVAARLPVRPVVAPEARAVRVPVGTSGRSPRAAQEPGAAAPRPRPPVPVPSPVGPRTSAAPFAAVPTPDRDTAHDAGHYAAHYAAPAPVATALEERRAPARGSAARPPSRSAAVPGLPPRTPATPPAPPLPFTPSAPVWDDDAHDAPWKTGRGAVRAPRVPGRRDGVPLVERRASRLPEVGARPTPRPGETPAYGDWTKPSGAGRTASPLPAREPAPAPAPAVVAAPLTTAIPDRDVTSRAAADGHDDRYADDHADRYADRYVDRYVDDYADPEPGDPADSREFDVPRGSADRRDPSSSPGTGPVPAGRAASRAQRQAREEARVAAAAARRKAAQRNGEIPLDDDEPPRRPRRLLGGLVAVGAVAAVVLGVHTVTTPDAEVAGNRSPVASSAAPSAPTSAPAVTAALPPLETAAAPPTQAAPAAPVRVPVTVLNGTDITGLAADISAVIAGNGEGWQTGEPDGYPNGDIAATTVYFVEGDDQQRQAALQLVEQFPQLRGPAPRFFDIPAGVQAPGLVVVAAGDWTP